MSYVNQVAGLPFRFDVPMTQPVQFRNDSPPFIPNGLNCPSQLQYFVPVICAMIANEAVIRHNAHQGRMFLFNQLSSNNWMNNDYAVAVATAIDILSLNMYKGLARTPEEGINKVVGDTLLMLCSLNFQTFPALQSVTPPEIVNDALNVVQAFYNISNEINNFKNRVQGIGQPQQFQTVQQPMMMNPNFNSVYQPPQSNNYSQAIGNNQGTNVGIFNNQNRGNIMPPSTTQQPETSGKYDYLKPTVNSSVVNQTAYFNKENQPMKIMEHGNLQSYACPLGEENKPLVWGPTSKQYYPVTINPYTHSFVLEEIVENNKRCAISYQVPLEDAEMDRKRHVITSMEQTQTAHIPNDSGTRASSLYESTKAIFRVTRDYLEQVNNEPDETKTLALNEIKTLISTNWGVDNFIESAIFDGRLSQKQSGIEDTDCKAYRVYKIIAKPIVCDRNHSEFLNNLSNCKSFRELASILSELLTINNDDKSLMNLCYEVDKLLTIEINDVLRNRMSIPNITIDSFIDDVNELPEYLGNMFGSMYKRIFLEFQRNYIPNMLGVCDSDVAESLRENLGNDNTNAVINFIDQSYSITYLNVLSYELGIKPYEHCASSLLENENPLMYSFVSGLFNQDNDLDKEAFHNLIVTSDNKIYEVFKGMIGSDFYTICEVK